MHMAIRAVVARQQAGGQQFDLDLVQTWPSGRTVDIAQTAHVDPPEHWPWPGHRNGLAAIGNV